MHLFKNFLDPPLDGSSRMAGFMDNLGTPVSDISVSRYEKRDRKRIKESEKAMQLKEKKKRAVQQQLRTAREEALREKEGVSYEAGAFLSWYVELRT